MKGLAALALAASPLLSSAQSPVATMGRPVPVAPFSVVRASAYTTDVPTPYPTPPVQPVVATVGVPAPTYPAAADLSAPPGSRPADPAPTPPPPPQPSRYSPPDPPPPGDPGFAPEIMPSADVGRPVGPSFWEKCGNLFNWGGKGSGGNTWASDNCLPGLISPVTMPFYAEDPRSLTEIRPIFMYQGMPSSTVFGGGNIWFFGTQARLAFTERFSLVINELGFMSFNPDIEVGGNSGTGFAALKVTPKYTFLRNPETGSVAAAGLMFDMPIGSKKAYQDTGTLSLAPYVSYGQTFGRLPGGYGSLNFIGNLGYSFAIDNDRTDFLYSTLHLDWNIANANTFFPLLELNWINYTSRGSATFVGTEGADLINFGASNRQGSSYLSMAAGLRYRFSEHVYLGAAFELPVSSDKSLNSYRLTFDAIFRY
jgi:hypothetical protein